MRGSGTLILAILLLMPSAPQFAQGNPCIQNPVFPSDCVQQLGAIGEPVEVLSQEGFLNIQSPAVTPILLLAGPVPGAGRIYALNPTGNRVRVLDPAGSMSVVKDIPVCYRPSSLAQNDDGSLLLVSCHAANAIELIDTSRNEVIGIIQDRDALNRPLLEEPMGIAVRGGTAYVASSQNNRIAVVDIAARRVVRYMPIPGADPRSLALSPDGKFLIVANFLAGNRTEPEMGFTPLLADTGTPQGATCLPLLSDPSGLAVFLESSPGFMNTAHPQFKTIAECYLLNHIFAPALGIVINPARTDHDLVVVRVVDGAVVFTTNVLPLDIGTLNYSIAINAAGTRVYLATTHARNDVEEQFGNRPVLNRLVTLDFDPVSGVLSLPSGGIKDLDESFLDPSGNGASLAATPYGLAVTPTNVLLTAAGSDRLLIMDANGQLTGVIPVGFTPKGVVARAGVAFVYNAVGMTVSKVNLAGGSVTATASIGSSPLLQSERIGAHLFNSAQFAANKTFACASCHPDGHNDGLVWQLNSTDRLRVTQTIQEISETAPYHWDGSKCNLVKILQDGITGLFGNPNLPTDCEMKTMIDFMNSLVRPHSPYRPLDDSMTPQARLGLMIMHRGNFKDVADRPRACNGRPQDPATEQKFLAAAGDPFKKLFNFNGGGGPFPASVDSETCGTASCHVSPHWESDGIRVGDPNMTLIDGFQAVSNQGAWDRIAIMHDARTSRAKFLIALDAYRSVNGAVPVHPTDNFTGETSVHGFNDQFFRHPEFNFDTDPNTQAFTLSDAVTRFSMEEEELQTGATGLTVVLDPSTQADPGVNALMQALVSAASQKKIALKAEGTLSAAPISLLFDAAASSFVSPHGDSMTLDQLTFALTPGDLMVLSGVLLPGQGAPPPKLKALTRAGSPILCDEAWTQYLASAEIGETDVPLLLHGIDVEDGSRVLVNGQVAGQPLSGSGPDFLWTLPAAGGAADTLSIQVLGPSGLQSNSIPLPVVPSVIPAQEPDFTVIGGTSGPITQPLILFWQDQFGITGPGTTYDIFRGVANELRITGYANGGCFAEDLEFPFAIDAEDPGPGRAFYYVARAENQVNVTTWGLPRRDLGIAAALAHCGERFP